MQNQLSNDCFSANPYYVDCETKLIRLHQLIAAGAGDGADADTIRDEMEGPERRLSREERRRLDNLSADLYLLQDDEVYQAVQDASVAYSLFERISAADRQRDWVTVLELLRQRPITAPSHAVAGIRGHAYLELGHTAPAVEFLTYALNAEPGNKHYRYELLFALCQTKRLSEAIELGRHFTAEQTEDLYWLIQYVVVLYRSKLEGELNVAEFARVAVQLDPLLTVGVSSPDISPSLLLKAYAALAVSRHESGDVIGARRSFVSACEVDPGCGPDHEYLVGLAEDFHIEMPVIKVAIRNEVNGSGPRGRQGLQILTPEWPDGGASELSAIFSTRVAA